MGKRQVIERRQFGRHTLECVFVRAQVTGKPWMGEAYKALVDHRGDTQWVSPRKMVDAEDPSTIDWSVFEDPPEVWRKPNDRCIVHFDGAVFNCTVKKVGSKWIATGTQGRLYTNRGYNIGAFVLERYSPNYQGKYHPTIGEVVWISAGKSPSIGDYEELVAKIS